MTVWVITLNGRVCEVCASAEAARLQMEAIKTSPKYAHEAWRPVGPEGWASPNVTSLMQQPFTVLEPYT